VNIGWRADPETAARIWDPELGGGVTLDMGVYGLWFAQFAVGSPVRICARGRMVGCVDTDATVAIEAAAGRLAAVAETMTATTSGHAEIIGTDGVVAINDHVVFAGGFTATTGGGRHEWRDRSGLGGRDGLAWEAVALATYVAEGRAESPLHSMADSITLASAMDDVRAQIASGGSH
jgi:predicted dehydrogenase